MQPNPNETVKIKDLAGTSFCLALHSTIGRTCVVRNHSKNSRTFSQHVQLRPQHVQLSDHLVEKDSSGQRLLWKLLLRAVRSGDAELFDAVWDDIRSALDQLGDDQVCNSRSEWGSGSPRGKYRGAPFGRRGSRQPRVVRKGSAALPVAVGGSFEVKRWEPTWSTLRVWRYAGTLHSHAVWPPENKGIETNTPESVTLLRACDVGWNSFRGLTTQSSATLRACPVALLDVILIVRTKPTQDIEQTYLQHAQLGHLLDEEVSPGSTLLCELLRPAARSGNLRLFEAVMTCLDVHPMTEFESGLSMADKAEVTFPLTTRCAEQGLIRHSLQASDSAPRKTLSPWSHHYCFLAP